MRSAFWSWIGRNGVSLPRVRGRLAAGLVMATYDWVIHGGDVVSGSGVRAADVAIADGVIAAVEPDIGPGAASQLI